MFGDNSITVVIPFDYDNPMSGKEYKRRLHSKKYGIYLDEEGNYLPEVIPPEPVAKTCLGRFYQKHKFKMGVIFYGCLIVFGFKAYFWIADFLFVPG